MQTMTSSKYKFFLLFACFCALIYVCMTFIGCTIVHPGQRGVRTFMGKPLTQADEPGSHLWFPIVYGVNKVDVQIEKTDIEASASSFDMQEVTTHVAVNWSLSPEKVVDTYIKIGDEDDVVRRIITPAVQEVFKASISKKTAEAMLSKRMELKEEIDRGLKDRLGAYGVTLYDVSIVNLTFDPQFSKAIEEKQIAEQRSKQASYEADKAKQDARAAVETARGEAEAQALLKSTLTKDILEKLAIEKWNGILPVYSGGNGAMPFLNLHKLGGNE